MRLALDAMGGDFAPAAAVEGAILYARAVPGDRVLLVGDEQRLRPELERRKGLGLVEVHHAPEVVGMDESPGPALRRKHGASIRCCLERVARGEADAAVSAGNSGATLAAARMVLGRLEHVERPAIAALLPKPQGGFGVLLDAGANVGCRAQHLVQYAYLGEAWARRALGIARPRVALLSNGEERSKGTETTRAAAAVLERGTLDFRGYVEGKDLFTGDAEVMVTDGFTGNLVLKSCEGVAAALGTFVHNELRHRPLARFGAMLLRPAVRACRRRLDWVEYGGAPLLGVDGVCLVAHGRSDPLAIRNALRAAARACALGVSSELAEAARAARNACDPAMLGRTAGA